VLALIVFMLFYFAERMLKSVVKRFTRKHRQARNLGSGAGTFVFNTAFENRRLEYDIGIGYGDDIDRAKQLIKEAIASVDGVLKNPSPDALVVALAESTVNIRARWWISPPRRMDALDTQDKVLTAIKKKLVANGIDLPFPTQQILFHDQTEETDGDRLRQREGWPGGSQDVPKPRSIGGSLRKLAEMRSPRNNSEDGNGN
jgi:hypothetical protein